MDMYESKKSTYCYPGTNTLINKLDIKDSKKLYNYEKSVVALKLMALEKQGITGNFDIHHFISIHKFLFEDIYDFAGLFRTENIAKDYFQFASWQYIKDELNRLLNQLKNENFLDGLSKEYFAKRLAYYWSELNVLHPFREGNGRTIREFLRQLSLKNNYILNFYEVNSKELLEASIKSIVDTSNLEQLLYKCLKNITV